MRQAVRKKLIFAAAASSGLLGLIGYPALKSVYPIKNEPTIIDDYVDLPTATADLTKDILLPEGIGTGTDAPIDISHWLLLSLLKSKSSARRERALDELARQRRWNDAECMEIAQALDKQDIIHLARTVDADIRLFLKPPSISRIESFLESNKIEKVVKTILKEVAEKADSCSSCTNFYTNLSIRVRPDSNLLAMSDLTQLDKMMHLESRKRRKLAHNDDVIRLKAILNNIICGEERAVKMAKSGILLVLLYFRHKYKDDIQVNSLLAQILANLSASPLTRDYIDTNGWIHILVEYTRSEHLEISLPAFKALANLDNEVKAIYNNHIYLLAPLHRDQKRTNSDVIFVHGLVGSVFKSWRQGSVALDEFGNRCSPKKLYPHH
uniref:Protein SERAC1 n=1 Tax=Aceria tosichella TaxID=561515 RepID=A0A6G1SGT6_9ACAR